MMVKEECLWHEWYAWFLVKLKDDHLFWLERVWRRRNPQSGWWEYRSFRSDREKEIEDANRQI
ncbi:hypothetical protein [Agrobacterium tumefaciens]|uniref:hypothetical protein n=1 Tax=Agrobacterium tumefaciens TaxID=358 RepID=UPI00023A3FB5|nr:hypothetical protein AT5A_25705 [Agrobacterium tumefaciens 5A]